MPLPKPKKDETKDDFLSRCMDNDTMNEEYPDNKQRYAVCNSLWKKKQEDSMDLEREQRGMERAYMPVEELRAVDGGDEGPKFTGYVARFGKLSEDLGGFREKIAKGAFSDTIKEDDIRALWNHDSNYVLGRTTSGTLQLEEKSRGLWMELTPPETQWAQDLAVSIKRGDVSQMSFGFRCIDEEWRKRTNDNDEEENIRTLKKVELFDVSPVTYPAYTDSSVQVRSALEQAMGVEFRTVASAIIRGQQGLGMNNNDTAAISQFIATLTKLLPGDATIDPEQATRAIATKRRAILKKEGNIKQPH